MSNRKKHLAFWVLLTYPVFPNLKIATKKNLEEVLSELNNGDTLLYLGETPNRFIYYGAEERTAISTYLKNGDKKITLDLSCHNGFFCRQSNSGLFQGCGSIKKVITCNNFLAKRYLKDDSSLFSYCTNLEEIEISDSVEYIPKNAFSGCAITSIIIPKSVKKIGPGAFGYCKNLTSVIFEDTNFASDVDVSDPATNAANFTNSSHAWYKEGLFWWDFF